MTEPCIAFRPVRPQTISNKFSPSQKRTHKDGVHSWESNLPHRSQSVPDITVLPSTGPTSPTSNADSTKNQTGKKTPPMTRIPLRRAESKEDMHSSNLHRFSTSVPSFMRATAVLSPAAFSFRHSITSLPLKINSTDNRDADYSEITQTWRQEKIKERKILTLVWSGFPENMRRDIWKTITCSCDFIEKNPGVYEFLVNSKSCVEHKIGNDVSRTFPDHPMFRDSAEGKKLLSDLLRAYSVLDQSIGYCQGMNFVGGILLLIMKPEEAFWTYVQLMKTLHLNELFQPGARAIRLLMYKFDRILEHLLPKLHNHLKGYNIEASLYVNHWFITLYSYNFPLPVVYRIWDILLAEKNLNILLRVALAIMRHVQDQIVALDFESTLNYFRTLQSNLPPTDELIREAWNIVVSSQVHETLESEFEANNDA